MGTKPNFDTIRQPLDMSALDLHVDQPKPAADGTEPFRGNDAVPSVNASLARIRRWQPDLQLAIFDVSGPSAADVALGGIPVPNRPLGVAAALQNFGPPLPRLSYTVVGWPVEWPVDDGLLSVGWGKARNRTYGMSYAFPADSPAL